LRHKSNQRRVILSAEHVIGRLPTSTLVLDASFVSTAHALVRWNGQVWELRDLGSRNGTFLNNRRIAVGEFVALERGALLTFGANSETWELVDAAPPVPCAVPLDGGEASPCEDGAIIIPTASDSFATIYFEAGSWQLELPDAMFSLAPGQLFEVAGRQWRLECPLAPAATEAANESQWSLSEALLAFHVSSDEEHVALAVHCGGCVKQLGERNGFYLALILARQRLRDTQVHALEAGWVDVDSLLQMIPCYGSYSALNVEIFRLRRALAQAGARDPSSIVERRRGQVRFGTDRVQLAAWATQGAPTKPLPIAAVEEH
jgi:hypothetical protein